MAPTIKLPPYTYAKRLASGRIAFYWGNPYTARIGVAHEALGQDPAKAMARAAELYQTLLDILNHARGTKKHVYERSLRHLFAEIKKMDYHQKRPKVTRYEVELAFQHIETLPIADAPVAAITGDDVTAVHKVLADEGGISIAHNRLKWLRFALNIAIQKNWRASHPMTGMRIERPKSREAFWTSDQVDHAIATALDMGRPSIALAFRLAFDTGQRESDVLRIGPRSIDNNEIVITQQKTGITVRMPLFPESFEAIERWGAKDALVYIISESTGKPYLRENFTRRASDVAREAGYPGLWFADLRRSAVVRLARAGCSPTEIAAITGHTYAHCQQILETYLPRTVEVARNAIDKVMKMERKR